MLFLHYIFSTYNRTELKPWWRTAAQNTRHATKLWCSYTHRTSQNKKDAKKYVPLSKRQDKPDSALWLIKNHSKLKDSQIAKLVGITSASVKTIRNKSYWNYNNLNPKDPVAMGLFSQKDLLESLEKADRRIKREQKLKNN